MSYQFLSSQCIVILLTTLLNQITDLQYSKPIPHAFINFWALHRVLAQPSHKPSPIHQGRHIINAFPANIWLIMKTVPPKSRKQMNSFPAIKALPKHARHENETINDIQFEITASRVRDYIVGGLYFWRMAAGTHQKVIFAIIAVD